LDIVLATIKIDFGYYEKLFWHFEFGNVNLLTNVILANMYVIGLREIDEGLGLNFFWKGKQYRKKYDNKMVWDADII
jgi:hypothetical protein